jgi:hypothetical protein
MVKEQASGTGRTAIADGNEAREKQNKRRGRAIYRDSPVVNRFGGSGSIGRRLRRRRNRNGRIGNDGDEGSVLLEVENKREEEGGKKKEEETQTMRIRRVGPKK